MTYQTTSYEPTSYEPTSYEPTHYNIWITPTFVKDGSYYPFEGLAANEQGARRGINFEFRFIVNTLRKYFGDDLDFEEQVNQIKIATLSNAQIKILRKIEEDTCEFPVKYGQSCLKFEINGYTY
jgi:hypothetical protein